jgi:hypothetical protein
VWTGTARTPNHYRGLRKERTFETAFLEYGAMQNLVRATGRQVWYLNDPIEDNPRHDWNDYRTNWESTLTASLLQPEVWRYEVAPWPERIFGGRYPRDGRREERKSIPPEYATELQVVMQVLNDMNQTDVRWDSGTQKIGVLVSDSLMFQREQPTPSDPNMAQLYGQMLPLLKRGMPVTPVQLENVTLPGFLDEQRVLLLSYQGQKPLSADVHEALARWVKKGGVLVMLDDDRDPYNRVQEWWNDEGKSSRIPRQHLFEMLGLRDDAFPTEAGTLVPVGDGGVIWLRENPVRFALNVPAEGRLMTAVKKAADKTKLSWKQSNYLALRRGPYLIGAGLDESVGNRTNVLRGRFVNLFDPQLKVQREVALKPGARVFLLDLDAVKSPRPRLLASACKALPKSRNDGALAWTVEGVGNTAGILLLATPKAPRAVRLDEQPLSTFEFDARESLLYVRLQNDAQPHELVTEF